MSGRLRVGLVGSRFAAELHARSLIGTGRAEVVAVASPTRASRQALAAALDIPATYPGWQDMLADERLDLLTLAIPNRLHYRAVLDCARAGVSVFCEKPLALTLREADEMIAACRDAGVRLFYGEQLCFAPKYRRVKELIDGGAFGGVFLVRHQERHDGPHADWFYDLEQAGGGALFDMGCHGIEVARWLLDKPRIESVYAALSRQLHPERTPLEDQAVCVVRFEGDRFAVVDASWATPGGVDERVEIQGTQGGVSADLARGPSLLVHSEGGYAYAGEKAGETRGWSLASYQEAWQWGWPQEFEHVVAVLLDGVEPQEGGDDGRAVLEAVIAGYRSAATGQEVSLPVKDVERRPVDPWLERPAALERSHG